MKRDVVKIDGEKCTGCGECVKACSEGAIKMVGGKAVLADEACCDGLGACLPACPAGAISIEERDVGTVPAHTVPEGMVPMTSCPGSGPRRIVRDGGQPEGSLSHWPVQLRLVPENAPYLKGCDLLVAADCSAFACGDFHRRFIEGHVTVIGCPKLDPRESWEKLSHIVAANDIRSITAVRMDVPCCSGIANAALSAARLCGKDIEVKIYTVRPDGKVME